MIGGSGYDTDDKSDITHLHFLTVSTIYVVVDIIGDDQDEDQYSVGLSEIGAEGQKVQKLKLVTFFLL